MGRIFSLPSDTGRYGENSLATNGIQEVGGSIPLSSTNSIKGFSLVKDCRTRGLAEKCPSLSSVVCVDHVSRLLDLPELRAHVLR